MVKRTALLLIVLWTLIFAMILRIFYISSGNLNKKIMATAGNRTVSSVLYNSKGIIYDKNLKPLAGKQPVYYLIINPRKFDLYFIDYISDITKTDTKDISDKLKYESPFVLLSDIMPQKIEGVTAVFGYKRYADDLTAAHIVGYSDKDGAVGLSGIERTYYNFLSDYSSQVKYYYSNNAVNGVISNMHISVEEMSHTNNGVVLTIDKALSDFTEVHLKNSCDNGCVIVMDCNSGDILTLSSTPEFDAYKIDQYKDSNNNELINNCLVNQTVGSVFKIVVAACAILNGIDDFSFDCAGGISVNDRLFSCQNGYHHRKQALNEAFANSCNCYFIALGQLLGFERIIETAEMFGLDSSFKVAGDIYSFSGQLPENKGDISLANLSIGQGDLMLPPLTIARLTALICNGGYLVNPTIYKGLYIEGELINKSEYNYKSKIIETDVCNKIKQMCIDCVEKGTGKSAKPDKNQAGGKTASAQTGKYDGNGREILNTYFTGFYPADNPEYVITVFAQNGVSGSATCAPIFKEICNYIEENY